MEIGLALPCSNEAVLHRDLLKSPGRLLGLAKTMQGMSQYCCADLDIERFQSPTLEVGCIIAVVK